MKAIADWISDNRNERCRHDEVMEEILIATRVLMEVLQKVQGQTGYWCDCYMLGVDIIGLE